MFRTLTIVLAMAALVACAACNSVTAPVASDEQTIVKHTTSRSGHDRQLANRVELGDPGDGGGGSGEGAIPDHGAIRPGRRGGDNQYDDGNGSIDPGRRSPDGTGGR
jgi:hypothetical protein